MNAMRPGAFQKGSFFISEERKQAKGSEVNGRQSKRKQGSDPGGILQTDLL
jgi:hypothetical protein